MITYNDTIKQGDVIALGDVHATWEPYRQFLEWVDQTGAVVVLLGDLIDRGGEDMKVLNATRDRLLDPEGYGLGNFHVLRGNHEKMFLDAAWPAGYRLWAENGGNRRDYENMVLGHEEWINKLPVFITIGETLFIHGGTFPGHDPQKAVLEGKTDSLLWMRDPFLRMGPKLKDWTQTIKKVVHGHTPVVFEYGGKERTPVVKGDRVNIDTGAYSKEGCLTAYNVTQNTFQQFFKE